MRKLPTPYIDEKPLTISKLVWFNAAFFAGSTILAAAFELIYGGTSTFEELILWTNTTFSLDIYASPKSTLSYLLSIVLFPVGLLFCVTQMVGRFRFPTDEELEGLSRQAYQARLFWYAICIIAFVPLWFSIPAIAYDPNNKGALATQFPIFGLLCTGLCCLAASSVTILFKIKFRSME